MAKLKKLPKGCGYMGYEYGGGYLDSECFGKQLYDLDACDDEQNLFEPCEDIPCPVCRPKDYIKHYSKRRYDAVMDDFRIREPKLAAKLK